MLRKEMITRISEELNCTKNDARLFLDGFEKVLFEALAEGEKVRLTDIGILSVIEVADKGAINPQTMESIVIPSHKKIKFKVAKALKLKVK